MNGILDQVMQVESGGILNAQNPNSSAFGPYQFISGTWRDVIGRMRPDLAQLPDQQLLALRADPELSRQAADFYMSRDIVPKIQSAGFEPTPANSYLGWFLGPQGAVQALRSSPSARVADVFPDIVGPNANIKFGGKSFGDFTVGDLRDWSASKMQGVTQQAQPRQAPVDKQPAPVYSQDLGTMARRAANFVAPNLVDPAKPLTPDEAKKQQEDLKKLAEIERLTSGANNGFLTLMQLGQGRQQQEEPMAAPQIMGGKYRPLPKMRGFL